MRIIQAFQPHVEAVGGGLSSTLTPTLYVYENQGAKYRLLVSAGYLFDGASIPRACWTPLGLAPHGDMDGPALAHDLIYQRQGKMQDGELLIFKAGEWVPCLQTVSRRTADDLLHALCLHLKAANSVQAYLVWLAVRTFAGLAWARDDEQRKFRAIDNLMEAS